MQRKWNGAAIQQPAPMLLQTLGSWGKRTFGYLLCDFLLPVITHHSLIWLFNSHLPVYPGLHVPGVSIRSRGLCFNEKKKTLWAPGSAVSYHPKQTWAGVRWSLAPHVRVSCVFTLFKVELSQVTDLRQMSLVCPWQRQRRSSERKKPN